MLVVWLVIAKRTIIKKTNKKINPNYRRKYQTNSKKSLKMTVKQNRKPSPKGIRGVIVLQRMIRIIILLRNWVSLRDLDNRMLRMRKRKRWDLPP